MYENHKIKIYIKEKLRKKLVFMENYPLTILQAGSGFGKTTTVNEFLRAKDYYQVYSYICMEESLKKVWQGICEVFGKFDDEVCKKLKQISYPTEDNLHDITNIISTCQINKETFLILDNFQNIQSFMPKYFFNCLCYHQCSLLHIIINTHHINEAEIIGIGPDKILLFSNDEFIFSKKEIDSYFKLNGAILTQGELSQVEIISHGWICATTLQLLNFLSHGKIKVDHRLNDLIRTIIYEPLDLDSKHILLALSLLGRFSQNQVHIITGGNKLPDKISRFLFSKSFIRYDADDNTYILHELLQNFLIGEIEKLDEKVMKSMYKTIGDAYVFVGDRYHALKYYLEAKEIERLFSLPIQSTDFSLYSRDDTKNILERLWLESDKDLLAKHPHFLSQIVFELYRSGSYTFLEEGCIFMNKILRQEKYNLTKNDKKLLKAQLYLIESFKAFNDIEKMSQLHQRAYEILEGPLYNGAERNDSWTFGQTSVLYLFWSKIGGLDDALNSMDNCLQYYIKLTQGHGSGANYAMRAEANLMRGDDLSAEVLAHKAIYIANLKKQDSICFAGEMILLRIAVLRGNIEEYRAICNNILSRVKNCKEPDSRKMADMAISFVAVKFDKLRVADWLTDIEAINCQLYDVAIPFGMIIYLGFLLQNKAYAKVIGIGEAFLNKIVQFNFMLCKVYIHIIICIAYLGINNMKEAEEELEKAFEIALPDEIYLPFAEYANELRVLLEKKNNPRLNDLCKRQLMGQGKIEKTIKQNRLSPRERKVAFLASEGLTNKEIANRLFISAETVKSAMKNIFKKLNVKSRVQLKGIKDEEII